MSLGEGGDLFGDGSYVVPWECQHGSWLMQAEAPAGWVSGGESRSLDIVWDSPEIASACVSWLEGRDGLSWGDLVFLEDMRYYATETPSLRAARKEAEALRDAAENQHSIGNRVALKEKKWTDHGSMKFRVPRPCKYASLFHKRICASCSASVPAGQDHCSAKVAMVEEQERRRDGRMVGTGKMVARQARAGDIGVRTCGEALAGCWNHDQHRTCIYVHPDEPQWAAACAGSLRVKNDNRLVFCMAGEEGPVVTAEQHRQSAPQNRFSSLGGSGHGQQRQQGQRPRIPSQREAEERDSGFDRGIYRAVMGGLVRVTEQRPQGGRR
jgi:predicted nucleic acid-binding Zn ribbon protein